MGEALAVRQGSAQLREQVMEKREADEVRGGLAYAKASDLAKGLDACLLHEEDSDPGAYLFPLPMIATGLSSAS